ncbi:ABC-type transporter, ATP-binding protein [Desulforapulum autotrophicum HRM2]|uniref:ABC-type transporter, ATP-binding protein n=1 Tax=Desulforapulum autotrophicum (strain ATCC 43914 / DSM 3382 / VKM B-1955 / HRM2) TaxID=177437 RepID=C0QIN0_DESAH|nr:ATP-binding cassette domain-containing protein [Desulforapulum autotrophicum]ACN17974.1 ABC-type transporter, ATP-binding protein [Desulforapulum autotrophicum HRM2]
MNTRTDPIIEVKNLTAGYTNFTLFDNISFQVNPGEIFAILGTSGCGKSTLMKLMTGLFKPKKGSILIQGQELADADLDQRIAILRGIGVAFQSGALFGSMSVIENVKLPLEEFSDLPQGAMDAIATTKLALVGLGEYLNFMPDALSGGMKKRAALARAMALDPAIVFLDEPSAGLDPVTSAELDKLIKALRTSLGITFVIVTHELDSIFSIADRVIMLDKSTRGIIATGGPLELKQDQTKPLVYNFFNRIA